MISTGVYHFVNSSTSTAFYPISGTASPIPEPITQPYAGTAFTSFGLFLILFIAIQLLPKLALTGAVDGKSMGALIGVWGLFVTYMFIATLKKPRAFQVTFGSAALLFFVLAAGDYTGDATIKTIGGFIGIFCGASTFYLAMADILNETYGKKILPIG